MLPRLWPLDSLMSLVIGTASVSITLYHAQYNPALSTALWLCSFCVVFLPLGVEYILHLST